jgi:hypothetical protein
MLLAFYKVNNSGGYRRHTFDGLFGEPEKILEMFKRLPEDEYRIYDINEKNESKEHLTLGDFVEDYNDEILECCWWCIPIL